MKAPYIKFCGFTRPADAYAGVMLGADLIGLNFYAGSPRAVSYGLAIKIQEEVRRASKERKKKRVARTVAVLVNPDVEHVLGVLQHVKPDIATICIGQAASMGAFLLAAGAKGKRSILPNARVMIHQPLGGAQGQASDIDIMAKEILKMRERLNERLSYHTGQALSKIEQDTDRNYFMSAEEAKEYGIVDEIIFPRGGKK